MAESKDQDLTADEQVECDRDEALKRALSMPHKLHKKPKGDDDQPDEGPKHSRD